MDTMRRLRDEFLICPLCRKKYHKPKVLSCLHSFCKSCLEELLTKQRQSDPTLLKDNDVTITVHVKPNIEPVHDLKSPNTDMKRLVKDSITTPTSPTTKRHDVNHTVLVNGSVQAQPDINDNCKKTILCPVCKMKTVVSKVDNSDSIVDSLGDNNLLVGLLEKMDDQSSDRNCESCSKAGSSLPEKAEKWCTNCRIAFCSSCIKAHNVIKACREHVVISFKDMNVDPLSSLKSHRKDMPCSSHRNKMLEFYCGDCKEVICSSCVAVQHRRCELVETAADANRKMKPDAESLLKEVQSETDFLQEWEKMQQKEIEELNENKETLIKEVSNMRNRINEKLLELEKKISQDLEEKHTTSVRSVQEKVSNIRDMKKNLENTNQFLIHLLQYGSDSDMLATYDKVYSQVKRIKETVRKPRSNKFSVRYKFAVDPAVSKLLDAQSLGKICDIVDTNKESFMPPGGGEFSGARRTSSVRRSGTFRVEKSETNGKPSHSSTSSESVNSKDEPPPTPAPRTARRAGTLPRNFRGPRAPSGTRITHAGSRTNILRGAATLSLPKQNKTEPRMHKDLKSPNNKNQSLTQLCAFNGRTIGDTKKCWPLDVAILTDGTPVITDFHNKKIKAFDATGNVMGEVSVPSWPHGICDISKDELSVTLPELSTIVFIYVHESGMRIRRRIRTSKQYRGIACDDVTNPIIPTLVVTCCTSGSQSADVITLDGIVLQSFRDDGRKMGKSLFTWPYYITTNPTGDMIISDCEAHAGILCLSQKGSVKQEYRLQENNVQDPRGVCTDTRGNIFLADKAGNAVHVLKANGEYDRTLLTKRDSIAQPIALCISPFGQIIVTQENGDIKVFQYK